MVIAVILLHSRNASFPMLFTELGILTDFRLVQYSNVFASIVVSSLGILIDIRLLQLENAPFPMLVTEIGIVMDFRA